MVSRLLLVNTSKCNLSRNTSGLYSKYGKAKYHHHLISYLNKEVISSVAVIFDAVFGSNNIFLPLIRKSNKYFYCRKH